MNTGKTDLVSVIIPVYNVENYITDCILSVKAQTYNRLEIILVDDGSTDRSMQIAIKLIGEDQRFTILRQRHKGLSIARNVGLVHATGSYFMFLDSDDYLDRNVIQDLLYLVRQENCEIGICTTERLIGGRLRCPGGKYFNSMDSTKIISMMIRSQDGLNCSACAKLYQSTLRDQVVFPPKKYFEDFYIMCDIILHARCAVSSNSHYIYRQRPDSITTGTDDSLKKASDLKDALEHNLKILSPYPKLKDVRNHMVIHQCASIFNYCILCSSSEDQVQRLLHYVTVSIRKYHLQDTLAAGDTARQIIKFILLRYCPALYRPAYRYVLARRDLQMRFFRLLPI